MTGLFGMGAGTVGLTGCGPAPSPGPATFEDSLRTFHAEWIRYLQEEGRSPRHWDEMLVRIRLEGGETDALERVRNEQYDVAWGRVPADVVGDLAKEPLAEKEGMPTLYFDGHVGDPDEGSGSP